ncbi:hypothetical protein BDB01DRAFT_853106 [Pilobolus umbonatus]|nr:hypothetical protein BDB01DRAFT_853106 [Pilobolus umbonatus]
MNIVQNELNNMIPRLVNQNPHQQSYGHNGHSIGDDYTIMNHIESNMLNFTPSRHPTHHYNDQDQYPSYEEFDAIIQDYLQNLSSKKRDKALIDHARYTMILQVLKDPRNTAVSTAQFRFWVKKMFQLTTRQQVCHDGKPVAMREQIYGILVRAHREAHHGGRDKTSALVRRRFSWIPKELIARFVRHCPFCISRRNGNQQSPLSLGIFLPATPPTYSTIMTDDRHRAPSMIASNSSASSSASYNEEMILMAAVAHQQHQQHDNQESISSYAPGPMDIPWPSPQLQNYYTEANNSNLFDHHTPSHGTYYPPAKSYVDLGSYQSSDMEDSQPMTMQSSLYYPNDYSVKQNPSYLIDNAFVMPRNNEFFSESSPSNDMVDSYINQQNQTETQKLMSSPSLSPSSSSTSAISSPAHPDYHDTINNSIQKRQSTQHQQQNTLSLLSHQQSLF